MIDSSVIKPFLVYRQARSPEGSTGSWVQVSSLIKSIFWERSGIKISASILSDPYFAMYRHEYSLDKEAIPWHLAFVDRYPYIQGYDYRYQTVTFSEPQHAIKSWHLSDWVSTTPVNE